VLENEFAMHLIQD